MSDQKNASHRRGRSGRPVNRTLGAAVAAGGLALSALLYPLPGDSQLLKLFPPNHKSSDLPKAPDFSAVDLQNLDQMVPDLLSIDSHDLARLVDLGQNLDLPTPVLLGLVQTYGVANVVMLLDSLAQTIATASGGGGGGGGGSAGSPVASPILLTLLDVLRQNSPGRLVNGWSEFVGAVVPQVLRRMGIPAAAAAVQQPEAKLATVAGTAAPAPNQEPAPIPSPEPQPVSVQQSGPALRPEPAPVATEESVPQPTQEPKPLTNQLQAAVSSETPTYRQQVWPITFWARLNRRSMPNRRTPAWSVIPSTPQRGFPLQVRVRRHRAGCPPVIAPLREHLRLDPVHDSG